MEILTLFEELKIEDERRLHANRMEFAARADRMTRFIDRTKVKWLSEEEK